ncbi:uncharacterized protein LOC144158480 isoform X3 [Haemaphysalis longicornis]
MPEGCVTAMSVGAASSRVVSCSQQTQATVTTSVRGTQCAPPLLISASSQTEKKFPVDGSNPTSSQLYPVVATYYAEKCGRVELLRLAGMDWPSGCTSIASVFLSDSWPASPAPHLGMPAAAKRRLGSAPRVAVPTEPHRRHTQTCPPFLPLVWAGDDQV